MNEISETLTPEDAYARLQVWYQKQRQLAQLKQEEHLERVTLSEFYFTQPVVGTNRLSLGGGYDLKLTFKYNYSVDEAALDNVAATQIKKLKLPWDELFVYKPSLSLKAYNALSAEQKQFVDTLLDIKPASPALEIVPSTAASESKAAPAAPVTETPAVITGVDDPEADDLNPGDYYEDGDGQWWLYGEDGWEQCDNPNATAKPKAKRTRKPKGAA